MSEAVMDGMMEAVDLTPLCDFDDVPSPGTACYVCREVGHFCPAKGFCDGRPICRECATGEPCGQNAAIARMRNGPGEFEAETPPAPVRVLDVTEANLLLAAAQALVTPKPTPPVSDLAKVTTMQCAPDRRRGRQKVMRPCSWCGLEFGTRDLAEHRKYCEMKALFKEPTKPQQSALPEPEPPASTGVPASQEAAQWVDSRFKFVDYDAELVERVEPKEIAAAAPEVSSSDVAEMSGDVQENYTAMSAAVDTRTDEEREADELWASLSVGDKWAVLEQVIG